MKGNPFDRQAERIVAVIDSLTSPSLLGRVRDHDAEAWTRLAALVGPLITSWCAGWGLHSTAADDVQQEVFQVMANDLETFRQDDPGESFRPWLQSIARRLAQTRGRPHDRRAEGPDGITARLRRVAVAVKEPDPVDSLLEVKQLHHRALELIRGEFDDRTWRAFRACGVEGRPPADIAVELTMTPAGVRKAKSRVLRRLKEEFGELLG
jgi:RNA polymerase sigma-70 factor (ECF subfamily)